MKKKVKKKTPVVKKTSTAKKATGKKRGPRPYKKCLDLIIQMTEEYSAFGDYSDDLLDEIAALKKQLDPQEQTVVGILASGVCSPRIIEIDEASPGSELPFKI